MASARSEAAGKQRKSQRLSGPRRPPTPDAPPPASPWGSSSPHPPLPGRGGAALGELEVGAAAGSPCGPGARTGGCRAGGASGRRRGLAALGPGVWLRLPRVQPAALAPGGLGERRRPARGRRTPEGLAVGPCEPSLLPGPLAGAAAEVRAPPGAPDSRGPTPGLPRTELNVRVVCPGVKPPHGACRMQTGRPADTPSWSAPLGDLGAHQDQARAA